MSDFDLRDYLDAKFEGVDQRFTEVDRRLVKIEGAGPRAGVWGGVGTMLGAAMVVIAGFFGIGPRAE